MLDFYNATRKHPCLVFNTDSPTKIVYKGTARECFEFILKREPNNPLRRDYERNYGRAAHGTDTT